MPATLHHGTSLENAVSIQDNGFDVGLSGSTYKSCYKHCGGMLSGTSEYFLPSSKLGDGVYAAVDDKVAAIYAKGGATFGTYKIVPLNPHGGCVIVLRVDLGRTYKVQCAPNGSALLLAARCARSSKPALTTTLLIRRRLRGWVSARPLGARIRHAPPKEGGHWIRRCT